MGSFHVLLTMIPGCEPAPAYSSAADSDYYNSVGMPRTSLKSCWPGPIKDFVPHKSVSTASTYEKSTLGRVGWGGVGLNQFDELRRVVRNYN